MLDSCGICRRIYQHNAVKPCRFSAAWHGESLRREALRCQLLAGHVRMLNYRALAVGLISQGFGYGP